MAEKKKPNRIVKGMAWALALCPEGSTGFKTIYKSKDGGSLELASIVKEGEDEGIITALVYAPEAIDDQGECASRDAIRQMAHSWMKEGAVLKARHKGPVLDRDQAYVVESFIIEEGDTRFQGLKDAKGNLVDPTGAWATRIQLVDERLRDEYRQGSWQGVSLEGVGAFEKEALDPVAEFITSAETRKSNDEFVMNEEELKAFADQLKSDVVSAVAEQLQAAKTDETVVANEPVAKEASIPEGIDHTNPAEVKAYLDGLRQQKALSAVDWQDPKSVERYYASLAKETEEEGDATPTLEEVLEENKRLQKQLNPASSKRPVAKETRPSGREDDDFAAVLAATENILVERGLRRGGK